MTMVASSSLSLWGEPNSVSQDKTGGAGLIDEVAAAPADLTGEGWGETIVEATRMLDGTDRMGKRAK